MRKIIVSEFVSLDGVMEGPGPHDDFKHSGWTVPYMGEEIGKFKFDELFASDALLLGQVTYAGFAKFWPTAPHDPFAAKMNSITKYVVAPDLQTASWNNTHIIKDNVVEEIAKLKQEPGKDILVFGSSMLLETLMRHNLVDEYQLLVYPVVLGAGKRLFKDDVTTKLNLIGTQAFKTGVVLLTYQLA